MSEPWQKQYGEPLSETIEARFRFGAGTIGALSVALVMARADELDDIIETMCRALLAVEWGKTILGYCHACSRNSEWPHASVCPVDAALTKAGLATQEQRDAARKKLGI